MASATTLLAAAALLSGLASVSWASLPITSPAYHRRAVALGLGAELEDGVGTELNTSLVALNRTADRVLSRAKRYVVFPKGSSLQLVYCLSIHGYVPLTSIFVVGLTMGLAWMLPTETRQIYLQRRDTAQHPDRIHRLKLYQDMGTFLNARGLQGQHCVLRTICESTRKREHKGNFMEELFQVLFSLPAASFPDNSDWGRARYDGESCSVRFPNCTSIIDIPIQPVQ